MPRLCAPRWLVVALLLLAAGCTRTPGASSPPLHPTPAPAASLPTPTAPSSEGPACSWLGVVIDGAIPARPQSGLSRASIVYEFPAEGLITRLLALYCASGPETVGPVRSVRIYMLDVARGYHAIIAHSGQSDSALAVLRRGADPVINEFWQPKPFRRDHRRQMPHNLYTSIPALRDYTPRTLPPMGPPWSTAAVAPTSAPMSITVPYGRGYEAQFRYDPTSHRYRRLVDGRVAVDALTGQPIVVGSVLVQYAHWWQVYEGPILTSRLELMGSGPIVLFTAGRRVDGQWHRATPQQATEFTDAQGRPLRVQPGPVWVCIVPNDRSVHVTSP